MKSLIFQLPFVIAAVYSTIQTCSAAPLRIVPDESAGTLSVTSAPGEQPMLVQQALPNHRPFIHPITAPDGQGVLTEFSPGHHKHQTGLYWGLTRVNGRDYFHNPGSSHWRRVSAEVLVGAGEEVQWRTVYDLLGEDGQPVLTETQTWSMREVKGQYLVDLRWAAQARIDVTVGKYDYGGLFLRMPWRNGMKAEAVNAARQRNQRAEGQRSIWLDLGMQVHGRDNMAHIAIFDHPQNAGFPQPWRVDGQFGVGPVRARLGDWKIEAGDQHVIQHRLIVYTGTLNDVELTKQWSQFTGQGGTYAQWGIAQMEGREAEFLTPEKAVASMTLQDGFQVNAFASEPMITQPMAFCWDDRGRMWIAENRDYESRGHGFSKFGDSRILILEDTDRDGVADSRKVFSEGIPFPSAIAVGFGGLWLGAPPNLLFLPDKDNDDVADAEIEVRLTGWGIRDRHETLNSLHWGPDGWLYGCQGFATPSQVGKPAGKGKLLKQGDPFPTQLAFDGDPVEIDGGVWRYHPTKRRFEVVAHGFSNPWGIDYDAKGQLFISACVIPHLWHVIPGGIYHRQGGSHLNPHVYSDIQTITDHRHRSAHGGARVYLSDAFPPQYHGRIFMANIHEHAVLTDILEPNGSGFVGRHGDDFLLANNAQWVGFSVEIGPEGALYVLDWHDADICGKDVLNKETGRVFRVTPTRSAATDWPGRFTDVSKKTNAELVELQLQDSAWHARRARLVLQHRAVEGDMDEATRESLRAIFRDHSNADWRLRAMWTLHVIGAFSPGELVAALDDADPHVRAWAIQMLCEDSSPARRALDKFVSMGTSDQSPVVRLYLAAALQRIHDAARWELAERLVQRGEDAADHNIPKMIWFGVESLVPGDPQRAVSLAAQSQLPHVSRSIARRLADADELEPLVRGIRFDESGKVDMLLGLLDGLEGRFNVPPPKSWKEAYATLTSSTGQRREIAVEIAQRFGDAAAAEQMLATLLRDDAPLEQRRRAMQNLSNRRQPELESSLTELLDAEGLRTDAIRAMAAYDSEENSQALLDRYAEYSADDKLEVVQTLASRRKSGRLLTNAIKDGSIPRRDVPAYVARQLRRVVGNRFVDVWGPIDGLSQDREAAFAKYRALLSDGALASADPSRGREMFKRTCSACHTLFGEGGKIGPDLTGANRTNLTYVLDNVLTPSAVIQDAYKMQLILTDDGRTFSGILAGETERHLQLRVANKVEPVVIPKSQIEGREVAAVSMMPDGLLANLRDEEVVDLVAYLRSSQQVPISHGE